MRRNARAHHGTSGHSRICIPRCEASQCSKRILHCNWQPTKRLAQALDLADICTPTAIQTKRPDVCWSVSSTPTSEVEPPPGEHRNILSIRLPRFPRFVSTCCVTALPHQAGPLYSTVPSTVECKQSGCSFLPITFYYVPVSVRLGCRMYMPAYLLLGRLHRYLYVCQHNTHMYLDTTAASVLIIDSTVLPSHPSVLFLPDCALFFSGVNIRPGFMKLRL